MSTLFFQKYEFEKNLILCKIIKKIFSLDLLFLNKNAIIKIEDSI